MEIESILGRRLTALHAPARVGDVRKTHADITRAEQLLGYKPKVGFHEGMMRTAKWWLAGCPA